jgi:hypothetical protein
MSLGYDIEKQAREFNPKLIIEREQAAGVPFGPFHRQWLLERAPEQVRWLLRKAALNPSLVGMPGQGFSGPDLVNAPSANLRSAINTTTVETNLWDPALWAPIPALDMKPGKVYQVEFGGVMGTTATPTIAWRARCGINNAAPPTGTDLGISPTTTLGTFAAQPFYGEFQLVVRSLGITAAGASVTGNGFAVMPHAAAATATPHAVFGGAVPTTIDDKVAQGLGVSITWGTSNASNTLTPQWNFFRSLN